MTSKKKTKSALEPEAATARIVAGFDGYHQALERYYGPVPEASTAALEQARTEVNRVVTALADPKNKTGTEDAYTEIMTAYDAYRAGTEAHFGARMEPHARVYEAAKGETMRALLELTGEGEALGVAAPEPRGPQPISAEDFKNGLA